MAVAVPPYEAYDVGMSAVTVGSLSRMTNACESPPPDTIALDGGAHVAVNALGWKNFETESTWPAISEPPLSTSDGGVGHGSVMMDAVEPTPLYSMYSE